MNAMMQLRAFRTSGRSAALPAAPSRAATTAQTVRRIAVERAASSADGVRPRFDDEPALVAALRRGDDDAYEEIVRRSAGRMLQVARRILGDEEDARNCVQDSLLSAFRSIDRFAGDSQVSTWLHRIVVNTALMRLRSKRRRPETPIDDLLPSFDDDGHRRPAELADLGAADAGEELDRDALRRRVREAIGELPDSYRTILVLRDIEERSTEEVAEILGLTEGNVKTRLHRARQALKTLLERRGVLAAAVR